MQNTNSLLLLFDYFKDFEINLEQHNKEFKISYLPKLNKVTDVKFDESIPLKLDKKQVNKIQCEIVLYLFLEKVSPLMESIRDYYESELLDGKIMNKSSIDECVKYYNNIVGYINKAIPVKYPRNKYEKLLSENELLSLHDEVVKWKMSIEENNISFIKERINALEKLNTKGTEDRNLRFIRSYISFYLQSYFYRLFNNVGYQIETQNDYCISLIQQSDINILETAEDLKKLLKDSITETANQIADQSSNNLNNKKYLTKAELAKYWNCSNGRIDGLMREKEISYFKLGSILFDRKEMDEFMKLYKVYSKHDIGKM